MLLGYKDQAMALEQRRDALRRVEQECRYRATPRQKPYRELTFASPAGMACFVAAPWQMRQA